jgi:pyrroloquinoline quinone biosynthesis protein D
MTVVPLDSRPRLRRGAVVRFDRVRSEEQLLVPERVVRLNGSSGAILRACDGERTLAEVIAHLEDQFGVADITADVTALLDDFAGKGWVEW